MKNTEIIEKIMKQINMNIEQMNIANNNGCFLVEDTYRERIEALKQLLVDQFELSERHYNLIGQIVAVRDILIIESFISDIKIKDGE